MPAIGDAFRLGVNYWPSETAMEWLPRYHGPDVRRDFGRIRATGMDTVRVFLRWEDVQPDPVSVPKDVLAAVVDTADAAADAGLDLIVTLFTGHMSGVNWIPSWATGGQDGDPRFRVVSGGRVRAPGTRLRNWYSDVEIVDAQARLAGTLASTLAGHPALWAWDLGNENSNCTIPPDAATAERWLERMCTTLRERAHESLITVGTHMEDLEDDRRLGPAEAARHCDFVCMHGYPIYASWADGPTDPLLVPFLSEITRWLAADAPVLFAEFGHATAAAGEHPSGVLVTEAEAAQFVGRTIDALHAAGAIGALLWCYADYAAALHLDPPLDLALHERSFGLWRSDGTPKPAVAEIAQRRGRTRQLAAGAAAWIDITPEEFAADRRRQLVRLLQRFRDASPGMPA